MKTATGDTFFEGMASNLAEVHMFHARNQLPNLSEIEEPLPTIVWFWHGMPLQALTKLNEIPTKHY